MRALCFCLFLLCPATGRAQEFKKVVCRFLSLDSDAPPPPLLNIADKGSEIRCTVTTNTLSPAIFCFAKGNTITFISTADRKPAATATIPANGNSFILVFVAAAKSPDAPPWRVFVIEDSAKNFPDGGAFVVNLHNQNIRFLIGESKIMLQPAGSHGFARPEKRDHFNMAPVVFEFQQDDTWIIARESMLRFLPGLRYLIFAYVDPASGRPRVSTFRDYGTTQKPPGTKPPAAKQP